MADPESVARWEFAAGGMSVRAPVPTGAEQEVIQLFDELRGRLLRYLLGFGVPAQEGEEVVQEVFLALFQHLQRGRSRQNLRGWNAGSRSCFGFGGGTGRGPARSGRESRTATFEQPETEALASRSTRPARAGPMLPLAACGGVALSGNRRGSRYVAGLRLGFVRAIAGAVEPRRW